MLNSTGHKFILLINVVMAVMSRINFMLCCIVHGIKVYNLEACSNKSCRMTA